VGEVGAGPRRVNCLEPEGTPCVVSSFNAGLMTVVDWPDRSAPPTLRNETVSVDGPVGNAIAHVGDAIIAGATGFNDNTLHLVTITADSVTDDSIALTGCSNPGHMIFLPGGYALVTCNGSDNYQVLKIP
jgi:hypothetical protein